MHAMYIPGYLPAKVRRMHQLASERSTEGASSWLEGGRAAIPGWPLPFDLYPPVLTPLADATHPFTPSWWRWSSWQTSRWPGGWPYEHMNTERQNNDKKKQEENGWKSEKLYLRELAAGQDWRLQSIVNTHTASLLYMGTISNRWSQLPQTVAARNLALAPRPCFVGAEPITMAGWLCATRLGQLSTRAAYVWGPHVQQLCGMCLKDTALTAHITMCARDKHIPTMVGWLCSTRLGQLSTRAAYVWGPHVQQDISPCSPFEFLLWT